LLFLVRLKYADSSLNVDRPANHKPGWKPNLAGYNLIYDFKSPKAN
jgi:hypothetical protein